MSGRIASIHTSDRILFKRCRRRWNWQSPLRQHLQEKEKVTPLWFGTGWHFVMEDFHGLRLYSDNHECWDDYVRATLEWYGRDNMPVDALEARALGHAMLDHYDSWLVGRDPLRTFVYNGVPQTEVNFKIRIPINPELLTYYGWDDVYYEGTIDRICMNQYDQLFVGEYKSAKQLAKAHFLTDPQITSYCWAAQMLYDVPVQGCMYQQWKKDVPKPARILKNGQVSLAREQSTTHKLYRQALIETYGAVDKASMEHINLLNEMAEIEHEDDDGFIRRDWIDRNATSLQAEGAKILMEVEEMLNPDLPLYPNPTRDCQFMCRFRDACISLDDGSDWEDAIEADFEIRESERGRDPWRKILKHQAPVKEMQLDLQSLDQMQYQPPPLHQP